MPDPFTTAVVLSPLALWAVVEWKARTDPDWPANCTPFVGAAQRWKQGRGNPEPEFVPEPEELPRIPPGMSDTEFEAWLNAEEPGRASEKIAAEMAEEEAETQVEFDLATGIANAELSIEQRRRRMERLRREVEERKKRKL